MTELIGFSQFSELMNEGKTPAKNIWKVGKAFSSKIAQLITAHQGHPASQDAYGESLTKRKWFAMGDYFIRRKGETEVGRAIRMVSQDLKRQVQFNWDKSNIGSEDFDSVDIAGQDGRFTYRILRKNITIKRDGETITGDKLDNDMIFPIVFKLIDAPHMGNAQLTIGKTMSEGLFLDSDLMLEAVQENLFSEALNTAEEKKAKMEAFKAKQERKKALVKQGIDPSKAGRKSSVEKAKIQAIEAGVEYVEEVNVVPKPIDEFADIYGEMSELLENNSEMARKELKSMLSEVIKADKEQGNGSTIHTMRFLDVLRNITTAPSNPQDKNSTIVSDSVWEKFKRSSADKSVKIRDLLESIISSEDFNMATIHKIKAMVELDKQSIEDQMELFIASMEMMFSDDDKETKYLCLTPGDGGTGKTHTANEFVNVLKKYTPNFNKNIVTITGSQSIAKFVDQVRQDPYAVFLFDDADECAPIHGSDWEPIIKNACTSGIPYRSVTNDTMNTDYLFALQETYAIRFNQKWLETDANGTPLDGTDIGDKTPEVNKFVKAVKPRFEKGGEDIDYSDLGITHIEGQKVKPIDDSFGRDKAKFEYYLENMRRWYAFKKNGIKMLTGSKDTELKEIRLAPFAGSIIFITNLPTSSFSTPILTRAYLCPVYADSSRKSSHTKLIQESEFVQKASGGSQEANPQFIGRYGHIIDANGTRVRKNLSADESRKINDYITRKAEDLGVEVNIRVKNSILEYASVPNVKWQKAVDVLLMQNYLGRK